jgi:hypothetical protein
MALGDTQKTIILRHANRLLGARDFPKTICPSEIARALSREELDALGAAEWRETMDDVRRRKGKLERWRSCRRGRWWMWSHWRTLEGLFE